ncbi:uncharacterized protein LOC141851283 [Brevipalpus obovatus]|uniref:uncharacterized protein LOC141851283 n=1 Tax=Brevipalpus obovatus TaxID=246614 RepID=UPI003D9EC449
MVPKFGLFVISIMVFASTASLWRLHQANITITKPRSTLFRKFVEFKRQILYDELKHIRNKLDTRLSQIPTIKPTLIFASPTTTPTSVCSLGTCRPPCVGPQQPFIKCPSHCKDC